jgi:hypothetical protein
VKRILLAALWLAGCGTLQAPAPRNVYSTPLPTPTLAVHTRHIGEAEKQAAYDFFYHLKVHMASRELEHIAEEIRYPIVVRVSGQSKTFVHVAELDANFEMIFSEEEIQKFISIDESELTFTPSGVKVADGILWFDLLCMDPDCSQAEFFITEIND